MRQKAPSGTSSNSSKKQVRPSTASTSTSSRRRRSDSGRRRQDDLAVEPINDGTRSKPRIVKGIQCKLRERNIRRTLEEDQTNKTQSIHVNLDRDRPTSQLQKQRFQEFTRDAVNKGVKGILDEYMVNLKSFVPIGVTKRAFDANSKKNRYHDVICIDNTRVILKNQPADYIHANFVCGEPLVNTFILTQGPMMNTVKDFWKMVAQENVGNIIMLCETVEVGKEKCQQYWPREEGCTVEWPGVQIKNVKMDITDSTTVISTLELVFDKKEKITLKHHHWKTWPDKSVPLSVLAPFRLLRNVRHSSRPTIVHCSAGIGRTGSVVALEFCYQQLLSENKLSVLESVKLLRHMRMHSVQTDLQYLYLFKCLLIFSQKNKTIPPECMALFDNFQKEYQAIIDAKMTEEKPETYAPLLPMKFQ